MESNINVNWFPGHMAKAKRQIKDSTGLIDVILEMVDARVPLSSRNPDIKDIVAAKPLIIVLNKCDLADEKCTNDWVKYYGKNNIDVVCMECDSGKGINLLVKKINSVMKEKILRWKTKGIVEKEVKVMVLGEPNTGKSSLINRMSNKNRVKAENRPGVTRSNQWISTGKGIQILDTPGILPPKIDGEKSQMNLSFTGAIKDEVIDIEQTATKLIGFLFKNYPKNIMERYNIKPENVKEALPNDILRMIAKKRGFLLNGGETDTERASKTLISEFRSGKIGRITLEKVGD